MRTDGALPTGTVSSLFLQERDLSQNPPKTEPPPPPNPLRWSQTPAAGGQLLCRFDETGSESEDVFL